MLAPRLNAAVPRRFLRDVLPCLLPALVGASAVLVGGGGGASGGSGGGTGLEKHMILSFR